MEIYLIKDRNYSIFEDFLKMLYKVKKYNNEEKNIYFGFLHDFD